MSEPTTRAAGTIYDLGYQRYAGTRLGRGNALRTLIAYSVRSAFGLGRGSRAKTVPLLVLGFVYVPAVVSIGAASMMGMPQMVNYAGHLQFTAFLLALFAASQAPELIVTDRQQGVLSLYLSRALRSTDYAAAKLIAFVLAMLILTAGPQVFMFFGKVLLSPSPWPALQDEWRKILPILGGTILTSIFFASIGLALSSFATRRAYANAAVIAFFILTPPAAEIFRSLATGDLRRYAVLLNPIYLVTGFTNWLFDIEARRRSVLGRADLPEQVYLWVILGVTALMIGLLMYRYRRNEP
jgi:ABC-2 type transport system permease protein